jgi:hypothetical protein
LAAQSVASAILPTISERQNIIKKSIIQNKNRICANFYCMVRWVDVICKCNWLRIRHDKHAENLTRFDTRELARHGDPARYRRRVAEFLALYERLRAGEAFTDDFSRLWLDALAHLELAQYWRRRDDLAAAIVATMKAELPCYAQVGAQLAKDMNRLYDYEERTRENYWRLRVSGRLEMARLRIDKGWLLPSLDPAWRNARRMQAFAQAKLDEMWEEAHPRPQVKVVEKHIHHTQTIYQPVPPYRGGF